MKKFALTCLSIFLAFWVFSQNTDQSFPASWEGEWSGNLVIYKGSGMVQELPMELHIHPLDTAALPTWTWTIIYGEDKAAGRRPYELVALDPAKGLYLIDEKNSIKMEGYLLGGQFYQWFEVQGTLLLTKTEKVGDALVWEIAVSNNQPVSTTGNGVFEGEEIPPVNTYAVNTLQRAVLQLK